MPATNDARFWDRVARKYAANKIADPAGYERTLERTRQHLKPDDRVVEFGCGTGTSALKLASSVARLVGTDISPGMIAIARENAQGEGAANVEFIVATPEAAPWPDAAFDAALSFNALHLIAAREAALRGIHRVLKSGGLFISKTPCIKEIGFPLRLALPAVLPLMQGIGAAPYVAWFSAEELEREIASAGFEIVARERHASRGKDARIFLVARKL